MSSCRSTCVSSIGLSWCPLRSGRSDWPGGSCPATFMVRTTRCKFGHLNGEDRAERSRRRLTVDHPGQKRQKKIIESQAARLDGTERQRETAATDGTNCPASRQLRARRYKGRYYSGRSGGRCALTMQQSPHPGHACRSSQTESGQAQHSSHP